MFFQQNIKSYLKDHTFCGFLTCNAFFFFKFLFFLLEHSHTFFVFVHIDEYSGTFPWRTVRLCLFAIFDSPWLFCVSVRALLLLSDQNLNVCFHLYK